MVRDEGGLVGENNPVRGMTERSDSATIIAGAAEDPAPRLPVKPQAPAIRVGALGGDLPASTTGQGGSVTSWRQQPPERAARGQRRAS